MRYRNPEEMKTSGIEWSEDIPHDWDTTKLKFQTMINMGQSPPSDGYNKKGIGTAFLQGNADFTDKYPQTESFTDNGNKFCQKEDILFSVRAPVGEINIADKEYCIGRGLCSIAPKGIDSNFLWHYLHIARRELKAISTGSTFESVSSENVKNLSLILPPLPEQSSIAAFLDRKTEAIDELIQKKEQLIERLKEKRQALITRAVTKGLDPDVPMKDSGIEWLGKIPEEWELIKFKHIVDLVNDSVEDSEFSIALENIESWTGDYIETDSKYSATGTLFGKGDVLFGKLRPYLAKVYLANQKGKAIGDIYVFRGKKVIPKYLFMIVDSKAFIDIVNSSTYGAKMPRASWDFIGELKFPIPNIEKQREIVRSVESSLKSSKNIIDKIDEEIHLLKEYRKSLISAAVTGKIDVRANEVYPKTKKSRKEISSWDKFVLAMEIIKRMQDNQHFGRIMLVKILFLIEYHLRVKGFNSNYKRWDHGPFDNKLINSVEYNLKKDGWINIESEESKNYDQKVYTPTKKAYEKSHYFKNSWGDLDDEIEKVLRIFNDANSTQAEIIATVYAAYNDLLIEGKEPREDEVLDEVLNNWHPNKKKISEKRWRSAYRWIKEKELVPTGFGKSTKEAA